jgi:hypothetical protein
MPRISRLLSVAPNPGPARQSFAIELASAEPGLSLSLFTVTGQLVFRRGLTGLEPGIHRMDWDGRMRNGDPAPPGVYVARLEAGAERGWRRTPSGTLRVVRIR